jgi:hypothetical protein
MAAIDFSHFFPPMRALSARPRRRQSRITPDAGPAPNFDHDRRLHKHIAHANFYPNVNTTAYGATPSPHGGAATDYSPPELTFRLV